MRVVTLNLWGIAPPLDQRLELAARQLRALAPDVVCLQEVRPLDGIAGPTSADVLAERLGMHASYAQAVAWDGGQEGLAIVARAPVASVRVTRLPEPRPADARILLSGQVDGIWVHTTHLHYRLDDGLAREHQVLAIDAAIRALGRDKDDAPQILCGDFNATPDSDEMRFLRGLTTLGGRRTHFQDAWLRLHREPEPGEGPAHGITWSSENRMTRPLRSLDIDRRIDYVLVTSRKKDGRGTIEACRVVMTERAGEGDAAICASDHYGVLAEIRTA
ncbi:MAG TPA: endonuclease/exonuclease/phosphatase family protein [Kofleriaceae bacterium]|nr:endonuclease/exonuclease/phosphatase family protein [Kofleriaceae bacterium]